MNKTVGNKKLLMRNVAILLVSLVLLCGGSAMVYADSLLSKINTVDDGSSKGGGLFNSTVGDSAPAVVSSGGALPTPSGGVKLLNGLYHDDSIVNILLLGADDYQENDVGRSDSMMLVSVDTRHKELKVTSFMRDMYVYIPGIGNNKLNAAYSLAGGGTDGARKVSATIEANFGIDIDRWVIVDFSAFPKIIDALGGVEITLSKGEADLVNRYSADPRKNLKAGTFNLSGLQARYYSRIRDIGDDFERTQRQRNVFSSIITKFKTADIFAINNLLVKNLPLITTNLTKDEVLGLASNALTYMNYPMNQSRVPADGEYTPSWVKSGTVNLSVLAINDMDKTSRTIANFVFGTTDLPYKSKSAG